MNSLKSVAQPLTQQIGYPLVWKWLAVYIVLMRPCIYIWERNSKCVKVNVQTQTKRIFSQMCGWAEEQSRQRRSRVVKFISGMTVSHSTSLRELWRTLVTVHDCCSFTTGCSNARTQLLFFCLSLSRFLWPLAKRSNPLDSLKPTWGWNSPINTHRQHRNCL